MIDKLMNFMKLNDDDNDYYDDDDDDTIVNIPSNRSNKTNDDDNRKNTPKFQANKTTRKITSSGMEVCVIRPTSIEDAREITLTLLENRTVVLNLEGLDVEIAQRIIDFASGSCYAIEGTLQKISHYIFIITPSSVGISGDFQEILNGSVNVPSFNE
ncbi:MAG: cell division protein SepF [Eubacteriales bacterium]